MTAAEICSIIKACANTSVREFRIGDLYLAFGPKDPSVQMVETKPLQATEISEEARTQAIAERVEQDLDELKLTDPFAYERLLGGEIGDGNSP